MSVIEQAGVGCERRGGKEAMLARWNPWQELFDMQRETSELLRRTFGSAASPWSAEEMGGGSWSPAIDVFTRDGDLVIRVELPGVDPDKDVDISVQRDVLTIRGERRHDERFTGEDGVYRVESRYGAFSRSVALPEGVNVDDIRASHKNGILEVVVPKVTELTAPKKVEITAESSEPKNVLTTEAAEGSPASEVEAPAS